MEDKQINKGANLLYKAFKKSIVIIALLVIWLIIPKYVNNLFVPSLFDVLKTGAELAISGKLWINTITSLRIAFIGLIISTVIAVPLGVILGWFKTVEEYIDPTFQIIRNTSILAILPIFLLIFGVGDTSKYAIIIWATLPITLLNTVQGVKNADPVLIQSARSMGIGNFGLFTKVIIPSAMPFILAGFRLSASISLIVLVGAEMLGARYGLGFLIYNSMHAYMIPEMYVGILMLAIIGIALNAVLVRTENYLTRWQEKVVQS
ncbi:MAG: ABC transporter permease [Clostridiales Family XIII bacterium]|jgi:NitT/TauT family transport system permease protein|nr:ABC transporter permease [Clostridiales Family XIII bacterium]